MRHEISITALCVILLGLSASASANHSWGGYHWARQSNPMPLNLGDNLSASWKTPLAGAQWDWNASSVLDTKVIPGQSNPKRCGATNGRVEVCNSQYGNNGWLGIAQIWVSSGHIVQGVVKMNDTYFDTPTYDTSAWRALVMCQEVGHTFGLGHQDENFNNPNLNTCMDYTGDPESNQHPNDHDYQMLEDIYAHLDSYDSFIDASSGTSSGGDGTPGSCRGGPKKCGASGLPGIADLVLSESGQWGRLVSESPNRRQAIYELDLGDGHRIITHVFWVEDRARAEHH